MSEAALRLRRAEIERKTGETDITLAFDLDGSGQTSLNTGVPFFDHMLHALARHGGFDLSVTCTGDAAMDPHHTVEDVGIVLGLAVKQLLGNKAGIARYGHA
ncbi:MAG: imidazoleglycerol-phosphate dehydratase, partial [Bradyrhizobium sp.]